MSSRRVIDMSEDDLRDLIAEAQGDVVALRSYNVAQAAEALGCSQSKVSAMLADGTLTHSRHGSRNFIPIEAVDAFLGAA